MARCDHEMLSILVIDDDEAVRTLLADIISREEHQAVCAVSAEQGLELLPFWTFQVAFIDHNLPGMDGMVLGEFLRHHNPDMTIVIITGDNTEKLERRSRDLAIRFLSKPFRVEDILDALDAASHTLRELSIPPSARPCVDHRPSISAHYKDLPDHYAMPKVPARIEDRLISSVRRCLSDLGSASRYNERDRVFALSGLLAAQVLGLQLPRTAGGATLFEEYDAIMKERGMATEFEPNDEN